MSVATSARKLIKLVELVIVFREGVAKVIPIVWRMGMTVEDALKRASDMTHGISFHTANHDFGVFVTEIDDEANDMDGHVRWGWVYSVNGEMATVSCSKYELKPSDIVRWEYTVYDQSATCP
jgi:hypothetical protein